MLFHYAFLNCEKASAMGFEAYREANARVSDGLTEVVGLREAMFLASSGAVMGGSAPKGTSPESLWGVEARD